MVSSYNRVIPAIRIRVMPENALTGGEEDIGGNEPADFGVIVPALEVVEAGFGCFLFTEGVSLRGCVYSYGCLPK